MNVKPLLLLLTVAIATGARGAGYEVPVPPELVSSNHWTLAEANASLAGDTLTVHYRLPVQLVGATSPALTFTGKVSSAFVDVSGKMVHGVCMLSKQKPMTCMLRYPGLPIDEETRDEALKQSFKGDELLRKQKVVALFGNDPAGILSIDVAGETED